ncbi:HAD-IA family hydrolase [Patescibacteria group bacterium]
MINTIIFDFGGVLGTDSDTILLKVLSKYDFSEDKFVRLWHKFWPKLKIGQLHVGVLWKEVQKHTKVDIQIIEDEYYKLITVDKKMLGLCKKLKDHKLKLGILANESLEWMNIKRQKGNLEEIFNVVYSSADLKVAKPDPEAFYKTLKALESKLEETLFIDNMDRNTKAASKLGIKTILFKNMDGLVKELNTIFNINIK